LYGQFFIFYIETAQETIVRTAGAERKGMEWGVEGNPDPA
jgi:hypothetical protein